MDVYNLGKTDIILDMPWLVVHNLEINWEIREVKIIRCLLLCEKIPEKKIIKTKKTRKMNVDNKMDLRQVVREKERRQEKIKEEKKTEDMVPKRFYKWLKVFRKIESERMPTRKSWNHAIDLKPDFVAKKERIYLLSRIKREEVQVFIED